MRPPLVWVQQRPLYYSANKSMCGSGFPVQYRSLQCRKVQERLGCLGTVRSGAAQAPVDTSRRITGPWLVNTWHVQVQLRPQCEDTFVKSTGLCSVDNSRSSSRYIQVQLMPPPDSSRCSSGPVCRHVQVQTFVVQTSLGTAGKLLLTRLLSRCSTGLCSVDTFRCSCGRTRDKWRETKKNLNYGADSGYTF